MRRIPNKEASAWALRLKPFVNNNSTLRGEWTAEGTYTVFSYGKHFPLYVWCADRWYENSDRYSVTTSRHRSQARPTNETTCVPGGFMDKISRLGLIELTRLRLAGEI